MRMRHNLNIKLNENYNMKVYYSSDDICYYCDILNSDGNVVFEFADPDAVYRSEKNLPAYFKDKGNYIVKNMKERFTNDK